MTQPPEPTSLDNPDSKAESKDVKLGAAIASSHRHKRWAKCADMVAKLGDQEPLYAVGVALLLGGLLTRRTALCGTGLSILGRVAVADILKRLVKRNVKRTRPEELLDKGRYEREAGGGDERSEQSFPSGHVACTLAAAAAVTRRHPRLAPAALTFTGLVGVARIAKGEHWPSDVAAGMVVGVISDFVVKRLSSQYLR